MSTRLQVAREARGWTKAELARRARMNQVTVGQIEAGRLVPYASQIKKLARALGLSVSEVEGMTPAPRIAG
jgi:transcriptional regulator with XRE-family HTH domain